MVSNGEVVTCWETPYANVPYVGRALGIVPREEASEGYMDLQHDDYQDGDFLKGWQEIVLATAESIVTV